jgi:hypothetical protein
MSYQYIGRVSDLVKMVEREADYYLQQLDECRAVIKQLHRGYALPGEVTYIHPYDLAELLNKVSHLDFILPADVNQPQDMSFVSVGGVRFKQSLEMPQITNNIR